MGKDIVDKIMRWESGQMSDSEMVRFFGQLVKSGMAWKLQGMYGRQASRLIDAGYIDAKGNVNKKKLEELM